MFLVELKKRNVRLKDEVDSLAWGKNRALVVYTTQLGYNVMIFVESCYPLA
jgi:hypothetical protein